PYWTSTARPQFAPWTRISAWPSERPSNASTWLRSPSIAGAAAPIVLPSRVVTLLGRLIRGNPRRPSSTFTSSDRPEKRDFVSDETLSFAVPLFIFPAARSDAENVSGV